MSSRTIGVLSVLFALISVFTASAQTFRGSIQGTIMDSTGAAVPGAQSQGLQPVHRLVAQHNRQRSR